MPFAARQALPLAVLLASLSLGLLSPLACGIAVAFILWLALDTHLPAWLWLAGTLLGSSLLAAHLLPGVAVLPLTGMQDLGGGAPWQLRFNPDKALLAAGLLAWWLGQASRPWRSPQWSMIAAIAGLLLVPTLAVSTGILGWLPKWPEHFWPWLASNLLVTCLAEELLFRGLLQRVLVKRLGAAFGLVLVALLFGAVHLPFSPAFALLASLAGLAYGLVFHFSGERLWTAVALHGAVNTTHVLLLTYPI
ncbi:CPBP family intramembrane glutamic endopeptidase [Pseudomonas sp. LRF_L74]|uniref:CPBP family intramembrane glutamic endopeptidase n=1 Tax=Pseudomonas sp. LRF_L74 TaxID=3369422 RepID=UPI003F5DD6B1